MRSRRRGGGQMFDKIQRMPKLHIHLREGFADDEVEVRVDGRSVAQLRHVTTNYSIGLAAETEVDVPAGPTTVELVLRGYPPAPTRIDATAQTFLFVRREGEKLVFESSATPPAYL
jgi:hypothetical protein